MRLLLQDTGLAKCGRFPTKKNRKRLVLPFAGFINISILTSCCYIFFSNTYLVVMYLGDLILHVTNLSHGELVSYYFGSSFNVLLKPKVKSANRLLLI